MLAPKDKLLAAEQIEVDARPDSDKTLDLTARGTVAGGRFVAAGGGWRPGTSLARPCGRVVRCLAPEPVPDLDIPDCTCCNYNMHML